MTDTKTRNKALIGLGAALMVTVSSWFFFNNVTTSGLERLKRIDRVWKVCESSYASAKTMADSDKVDMTPLSEAIDSGKDGAPQRCTDMRKPADAEAARDSAKKERENRSQIPTRNPR